MSEETPELTEGQLKAKELELKERQLENDKAYREERIKADEQNHQERIARIEYDKAVSKHIAVVAAAFFTALALCVLGGIKISQDGQNHRLDACVDAAKDTKDDPTGCVVR